VKKQKEKRRRGERNWEIKEEERGRRRGKEQGD
jgi:hypothetical protein